MSHCLDNNMKARFELIMSQNPYNDYFPTKSLTLKFAKVLPTFGIKIHYLAMPDPETTLP